MSLSIRFGHQNLPDDKYSGFVLIQLDEQGAHLERKIDVPGVFDSAKEAEDGAKKWAASGELDALAARMAQPPAQ